MNKKNKPIFLEHGGDLGYIDLPPEKRPVFVRYITYDELAEMAFDPQTPEKQAKDYQRKVEFLKSYCGRETLNRKGSKQLQLYSNGDVWYCD